MRAVAPPTPGSDPDCPELTPASLLACWLAGWSCSYHEGQGMLAQKVSHTTIRNNEVAYFQSGISVGWTWTYATPSEAHDNLILDNHCAPRRTRHENTQNTQQILLIRSRPLEADSSFTTVPHELVGRATGIPAVPMSRAGRAARVTHVGRAPVTFLGQATTSATASSRTWRPSTCWASRPAP